MNNLGVTLKLLRDKHNISQEELSKNTGISRSNISKIGKNQISPSVDALLILSEILEVSTDLLLKGTNFDIETNILSDQEKNIICLIRNVSEEDSKIILGFLSKFKVEK